MGEDPAEQPVVASDDCREPLVGPAGDRAFFRGRAVAQQLRAQHGHEGERHPGGNENRDRERDRKLVKQPADDVAHEQQRNERGDQRDGQRDDGKADLSGALQRGRERPLALLDEARDVLDHHDGIVDHEAGGDGERHQREVVKAETGEVHRAEGADQRERNGEARDDRGGKIAQEEEEHQHHQPHRQPELELDVPDRGPDGGRAIREHRHIDGRRQGALELGQPRLDAADDVDHVGARLTVNVDNDRRDQVDPGGQLRILGAVPHVGHIRQVHRRTVSIGDDEIPVRVGARQLIVGVDRIGAGRPVEIALRGVDVGVVDRRAQVVDVESVGSEGPQIDLDAHGRPLAPAHAHQADAG